MTILLIAAILISLAISVLVANSAKSREVSQSKIFWVSFLLTPILGMFIAMMSRQLSPEEIKEREEIPKKNSENPVFIAGIILSVILLFLVSFKIHNLYQEKVEEQEQKELVEAAEKNMPNKILETKERLSNYTKEQKAYFADSVGLSSEEKNRFLDSNILPDNFVESMCLGDLTR